MDSRCCLLKQLGRCSGKKPCCSFLLFYGACFRAAVLSTMEKLKLKCKGFFIVRQITLFFPFLLNFISENLLTHSLWTASSLTITGKCQHFDGHGYINDKTQIRHNLCYNCYAMQIWFIPKCPYFLHVMLPNPQKLMLLQLLVLD